MMPRRIEVVKRLSDDNRIAVTACIVDETGKVVRFGYTPEEAGQVRDILTANDFNPPLPSEHRYKLWREEEKWG